MIMTTSSVRFFCAALLRNSRPSTGMSPIPGIFCSVDVMLLFSRPAIANVCRSRSSISVSVRRVVSAGMRKPPSCTAFAKSSVLTSGFTFSWMRSPMMVGVKLETDAELLEHDRHADVRTRALCDRNREFATGQEACFLAALRDEIRLGQTLEQAARLQRADQQAEVVLLAEHEQVEEVAETELSAGGRHIRAEVRALLRPFDRSLKPADGNCCVVARPIVLWMPVALVNSDAPTSVSALRLTSAKRTCSST